MNEQMNLPIEVEGELPLETQKDIQELVESDSFKGDKHSTVLLWYCSSQLRSQLREHYLFYARIIFSQPSQS